MFLIYFLVFCFSHQNLFSASKAIEFMEFDEKTKSFEDLYTLEYYEKINDLRGLYTAYQTILSKKNLPESSIDFLTIINPETTKFLNPTELEKLRTLSKFFLFEIRGRFAVQENELHILPKLKCLIHFNIEHFTHFEFNLLKKPFHENFKDELLSLKTDTLKNASRQIFQKLKAEALKEKGNIDVNSLLPIHPIIITLKETKKCGLAYTQSILEWLFFNKTNSLETSAKAFNNALIASTIEIRKKRAQIPF